MANPSTSTSTSQAGINDKDQYVFDVFINHRGPDVKRTLATDIYQRLNKHGLRVFLDEQELQEGEHITPQIESAIRTASVHIAIFSPGYADSRWCLDELMLMMESMSKSRSTIIPVFYGVKPSELRWTQVANGVYARALRVLGEKKTVDGRPLYSSSTIEKWRHALSEAAAIKGFDRATYNCAKTGALQCLEAVFKLCNLPLVFRAEELLEDVVEGVLKNVKRTLHVAEYPKGLEEKLKDFQITVSLQHESKKARVIGIVGLGGVGKTTLAKKFFNSQRSNYKRSSFLFDIRENSLTSSQSALLKDLIQSNEQIHTTDEGKAKLRRHLSSSPALIILDDVDHIQQLDALLLPAEDVLHTGSLILVTSRNKDILRSADILESSIYRLTGLSPQHSRELFCSHAFGQPHPAVGFDKVVENFLGACRGLPLSIKVLGALLRGKNDLNHWEAQFRKICNILPEDIQSRLKISYDRLDEEEKQIFTDIACFFTEEDKDTVIRIWDGSHWEGWLGLRNLENKCLVEIDDQNRVRMHDHLKDLGRALAEKELPGCKLRFWRPTDNLDDLSGQSTVRGISMVHGDDPAKSFENLVEHAGSRLLSNMSRLQLLRAEGCFVERLFSVGQLPQLIYLRWDNCPNTSLPSSIPVKNLRVLYIQGKHLKKLWQQESQAPLHLRELHIDAPLSDVPNSIGKMKHLEKIVLRWSDLETLPNEFCDMHSLKHVGLQDCKKMRLLPGSLGNLTGLENLDLRGCSTLQTLPDSVGNLTGLQSLDLGGCSRLQTLPDSVGNLTRLQSLYLGGCSTLQMLPNSIGKLKGLQSLRLGGCSTLRKLPDSIGNLTGLQSLDMYKCSTLQTLPKSVGNLTGLQNLDLYKCSSLQTLPDSVGNLMGLQILRLGGCSALQMLPDSVGKLTNLRILRLGGCSTQRLPDSVGNLMGLKTLDLGSCSTLQTLPDSIGDLQGLQTLSLGGCSTMKTLPDSVGNLMSLQTLDLGGCSTLQKLPDSVGNLTGLQTLRLYWCSTLLTLPDSIGNLTGLQTLDLGGCSTLQTLPDSVGNLTGLQSLGLAGCSTLQMLPDSLGKLKGLHSLNLYECSILQTLPDSVGNLTDLQTLDLYKCSSLHKLPVSVGNLTELQRLDLYKCSTLQMLPNSIGNLTGLKTLSLGGCSTLQTLPGSVGNLTGLQTLSLAGCSTLQRLPDLIGNLTGLQTLSLAGCSCLQTLPYSIGNLTGLQSLRLYGCSTLQTLPCSIGNLTGLQSLHLGGCSTLEMLPDSVGNLRGLQSLYLSGCSALETLPDSAGNLPSLKYLYLNKCSNLAMLPNVDGLSSLTMIDVSQCFKLQLGEGIVEQLRQRLKGRFIGKEKRVLKYNRAC